MNIIRPILINDAVLTATDVPENDEAGFDLGTTYALGARVMVTTDTVHSIYVSLQAGNTANQPEDEADPVNPVWWARESATNRWAMFSDQINDQTEQADVIDVELTPAGLVNAISLFNLNAASVQVVMTDPVDGVVYDSAVNMVDASGVNDWYAWYFEPIQLQDTMALLDLPPFIDAVVTVTITLTGGTAACGLVSIGAQKELGTTIHGTRVGIQDYSTKERDTFGNAVIIPRNFSKRSDYAVVVDTAFVGAVEVTLASLRTTPLTWIGDTNRPSTIVYGYYRDFDITLTDFVKSNLSIEVEGLT